MTLRSNKEQMLILKQTKCGTLRKKYDLTFIRTYRNVKYFYMSNRWLYRNQKACKTHLITLFNLISLNYAGSQWPWTFKLNTTVSSRTLARICYSFIRYPYYSWSDLYFAHSELILDHLGTYEDACWKNANTVILHRHSLSATYHALIYPIKADDINIYNLHLHKKATELISLNFYSSFRLVIICSSYCR